MSAMNTKRKRGGQFKYSSDLERTRARREQNRRNKRNQRLRQKLSNTLVVRENDRLRLIQYRNAVSAYFRQFKYTLFTTLTFDTKYESDVEKNFVNEFQEFNVGIRYIYPSINQVRRSVRKYIEKLSNRVKVVRYFYVLERGNGLYHAHVLFNIESTTREVSRVANRLWYYGKAKSTLIKNPDSLFSNFGYLVKEMSSRSNFQVDFWDFGGDFCLQGSLEERSITRKGTVSTSTVCYSKMLNFRVRVFSRLGVGGLPPPVGACDRRKRG